MRFNLVIFELDKKLMSKNLKTPKNALCVFAHPDDMDFSSSGTIAKWAAKGSHITYLVCTDGGKGSDDPRMTSKKLAAIRKKEQRDAAKILGVADVIFLNHRDGELTADLKLKEEIVKVIRRTKPDIVITLNPAFLYSTRYGFINHPDHRAAGQAALDAVFPLARDRLNFPQHEKAGLKRHKVKTVLLVSFDEPEHLEDVSKTIYKKIAALKAHKSQVGPEAIARITDRARMLARRTFARQKFGGRGKKGKLRFAEGFKKIDLAY